ncbi:unnamed protein product [Ectocarpus sp. 8 AP-2014]
MKRVTKQSHARTPRRSRSGHTTTPPRPALSQRVTETAGGRTPKGVLIYYTASAPKTNDKAAGSTARQGHRAAVGRGAGRALRLLHCPRFRRQRDREPWIRRGGKRRGAQAGHLEPGTRTTHQQGLAEAAAPGTHPAG